MNDVRTLTFVRIAAVIVVVAGLHLLFPHLLALDNRLALPAWELPHRARLLFLGVLIALTVVGWIVSELPIEKRPAIFRTGAWSVLNSGTVFAALVALTMVCLGWHTLTGFELDVDESHSILAARTLLVDPRFWVSTDVGTHGPVVSLCQLILPLLALKIDYAGTRLLGIGMFAAALLGGVLPILRRIVPEAVARLLLLPGVFLIASLRQQGYVAYDGEHPLLFLSLASAGLATMALLPPIDAPEKRPSTGRLLFLSGLLLGAVPWAKWQGVPLVAVIGAVTLIGCWFAPGVGGTGRPFARRLAAYLAGGILATVLILLWAAVDHALALMWRSYIEWNIVYANRVNGTLFNDSTPAWFASQWLTFTPFHRVTYPALIVGALLFVVACVVVFRAARALPRSGVFLAALIPFGLASWYCAVRPANAYYHYVLFFLFPTVLLSGLLWAGALEAARTLGAQKRIPALAPAVGGLFVILGVLFPVGRWWFIGSAAEPPESAQTFDYGILPDSLLVPLISGCLHPGERIAIWGWRPDLYVLADRLPAVRSPYGARESFRSDPMQGYFLDLYVRDLDTNDPPVFIDEVQPKSFLCSQERNLTQRVTGTAGDALCADLRHERYAPLEERIAARYSLWFESREGLRINVRKDRMPEARAYARRMMGR